MQETILDGKVKRQEIAYGYTKEVNDNAKPRTEKNCQKYKKRQRGRNKEEN